MPQKKPEIRFNIDRDVHDNYRVLCFQAGYDMTEMSRRLIHKWIEEQKWSQYHAIPINDLQDDVEK